MKSFFLWSMRRRQLLGVSAAGVLAGGLLMGAYQQTNPGLASQPFLNKLFASLSEDDKHDPKFAVGSLNVAPGLEATLFASEPMLVNPTNIDVDTRGRVWVCEAYNYRPAINGNPTHAAGDRIVILEDTTATVRPMAAKRSIRGLKWNHRLVSGCRVIR